MAGGRVFVGISGYDYPGWRGVLYPQPLPRGRWLEYAAARFDSIELNGTFYSLKSPAVYRRWRADAPPDRSFVFAVKGSRYLTHMLHLKDAPRALANFYASGVLALGASTGPFLWQLPPRFRFDADRVASFLAALPHHSGEAEALARRHDRRLPTRALLRSPEPVGYRHALEVRDPSFVNPELYALLRATNTALVVADTGGRFPAPDVATADFAYVRLHGPRQLYASGYTARELDDWAERIEDWASDGRDVYVYFDNDAKVHAPFDAAGLARRLAWLRAGEPVPPAVPESEEGGRSSRPPR
jgi:uncharacterized protein YecE (DUF72 family)